MEGVEVRKLTAMEDTHWWYAERRHLLARMLRGLRPGQALDVGAAGGGNTRVLRQHGWSSVALEYGEDGAAVAAERGLDVVRADATRLPLGDASLDLVVAFDVLEHIEDDGGAVRDVHRVLRPGGTFLVAVPCDPRLWSQHDVAVGHVRRYTPDTLRAVLQDNGFDIQSMRSWMVLLRPVVAVRRRLRDQSDNESVHPVLNAMLRAVVVVERALPVRRAPGVSLFVTARRVG